MKTQKKKPYVRPLSVCTAVELESQICNGSSGMNVESPHGGGTVEKHEINQEFTGLNDFTDSKNGSTWD